MNNDLISREALKKKFERLVDETIPYGGVAVNDMRELIDNAPTVEPEKAKESELIQSLTELCNRYCENCPIIDAPNECTDCICTHIRGIMGDKQ